MCQRVVRVSLSRGEILRRCSTSVVWRRATSVWEAARWRLFPVALAGLSLDRRLQPGLSKDAANGKDVFSRQRSLWRGSPVLKMKVLL